MNRFEVVTRITERLRRHTSKFLQSAAFEIAPSDPQFWQQRVQPDGPAAHAFRAAVIALERTGQIAEADRVLAKAAGAFPDNRDFLVDAAMSAHQRAQYDAAIPRWESALAVAPENPMCHAGLAANLRETGQLERAATTITAALDRFPGNLLVVTEAGRIASARGAHDEALSLWALAAGTPDAHPEWLHAHVRSLMCLKRCGEAEAALRQARLRHPDDRSLMQLEAELGARDTVPR